METYSEVMSKVTLVLQKAAKALTEAFSEFYKYIIERWDSIKEFIKEFNKHYQAKQDEQHLIRNSWYVPHKIAPVNQVFNRKQRFVKVRSRC